MTVPIDGRFAETLLREIVGDSITEVVKVMVLTPPWLPESLHSEYQVALTLLVGVVVFKKVRGSSDNSPGVWRREVRVRLRGFSLRWSERRTKD
jgi:hypothetical protein